MKLRRSLLFVPGARPERFDKAVATGVDMVCIDLEDACLPAEKEQARIAALDYASAYQAAPELVIRINSPRTLFGLKDLAALIECDDLPPLTLMLPKVGAAADVEIVDGLLANVDMNLIALMETAQGIEAASAIAAASPRVSGLMLGGADLSAELRSDMGWDAMLMARSKLAMAAASRQLDLIDVPYLDVKNPEGLTAESTRVRNLGFTCKAAIHPAQVEPISSAFTPSANEVSWARKVLAASAEFAGGALLVDGKLVDRPVLLAATRIVAVADQLGI
ncbi:CoA ester lyase [Halioxenophilus sp. WMMB6]|uniref:HpcH/HpaI aldolase/citrate lyase family protein n=1 Tax=Halioxenophilus sp. WMMB6 TaxID=3073815 RepID=UPI00295EA061|nr:CoA ester lyase [Halioxenophilus sp. WMMB6]